MAAFSTPVTIGDTTKALPIKPVHARGTVPNPPPSRNWPDVVQLPPASGSAPEPTSFVKLNGTLHPLY